jgi:hypothetical protein
VEARAQLWPLFRLVPFSRFLVVRDQELSR